MKFDVSDLVDKGNVKRKNYRNGLSVLKYHNKVFYDNLWGTDDRLMDCRGTVVDEHNNIVTMPFTKVFNLNENGTVVDRERSVVIVRKVNGFMASLSSYKGESLVSTTGTLDSVYANIARDYIGNTTPIDGLTLMFEICDPDDKHIVDEQQGAYLIGARPNNYKSKLLTEQELDNLACALNFKRPEWFECNFSDMLEGLTDVRHEGWMVRDFESGETLCKVKSPYYLAKKFFMRMSKKNVENLYKGGDYWKSRIDEEYYTLVDYIKSLEKDVWLGYSDQERRVIIEDFLK